MISRELKDILKEKKNKKFVKRLYAYLDFQNIDNETFEVRLEEFNKLSDMERKIMISRLKLVINNFISETLVPFITVFIFVIPIYVKQLHKTFFEEIKFPDWWPTDWLGIEVISIVIILIIVVTLAIGFQNDKKSVAKAYYLLDYLNK